MEQYTIYRLDDPRDTLAHYVGMSKDIYQRFAQHMTLPTGNTDKDAWILDLRHEQLIPILSPIETITGLQQARQRESYWIQHYRIKKHPLTNSSKGTAIQATKALIIEEQRYKVMRDTSGYSVVCMLDNDTFREVDGGGIYPSRQNAYHRCQQLNKWWQERRAIKPEET